MVAIPRDSTNEAIETDTLWLRNRKWDLLFITFSVIVVPLPYFVYLLFRDSLGDDFSRNMVNGFVAIAIGGPHMMSTFLRTGFDNGFSRQYPMLIRSSLLIPVIVISLAFLNLELLLTVFFFWAALHVLHQVTYIVELYNFKEANYVRQNSAVNLPSRVVDYALILTCLFPVAAYKVWQGTFQIGNNDLGKVIPGFFEQEWLFFLMTAIFVMSLLAYIAKTIYEIRVKSINWPKTAFIVITVFVAFFTPFLPNLDTAFQGLNTWHSFQYLAITFYILKIRQIYGNLDKEAPLVARFSAQTKDSKGLYLLSTLMLLGSAAIFTIVFFLAKIVRPDMDVNQHFDTAYYTSILAFLWIHYYHDHFLFTDFDSLDDAYKYADGKAKTV
jgi:hypothetical protein